MRNWRLILADAKARELSPREVAREQGVASINSVYGAMARWGVELPANRYSRSEDRITRTARRWARRFAEAPPGLTVNEFILRYRLCSDACAVKQYAREHGYVFAAHASKGRAIRGQDAIMER